MALVLLESLRMSCTLGKSIVLSIIVHNHFWLKWLIYNMGIGSLTR